MEKVATNKKENITMGLDQLTTREVEVLNVLFTGKTDKEAAEELQISHYAIKSHCFSIYKRLGVSNRASAFYRALELDILQPPKPIKTLNPNLNN